MRVSFNHGFSRALSSASNSAAKLLELNRQLETGKRFQFPSDDPLGATQSRRLKKTLAENAQFKSNIEDSRQYINSSLTAFDDLNTILNRIRTLAVRAANDTYNTVDRAQIAKEVDGLLENAVQLANTHVGNRAIFGGAETIGNPFKIERDAGGEIVAVNYTGDRFPMTREVEQGVFMAVTETGLKAFGSIAQEVRQQAGYWNGAQRTRYADRELSAVFIPSGGVEGSFEINGTLIEYDLDGNPTDDEGDSLIDLANKINDANAGVTARVDGRLRSTNTVADPTQDLGTALPGPPAFQAGTVVINGVSLSVSALDTLATLRDKINTETAETGVSARIVDSTGTVVDSAGYASATGPFSLKLLGGVEIGDTDAANNTNAFQLLGITRDPAMVAYGETLGPPGNLTGTVLEDYRLVIQNNRGGLFELNDREGTLLSDLGFINPPNADPDTLNPPYNIQSGAMVESGSAFQAMMDLRDSLRTGDSDEITLYGIERMDAAIDAVNQMRTDFGTRSNRLQTIEDRINAFHENTTQLISDVEDVNLAEVISELNLQLTAQQAALRSASVLLSTSLLNFLS